jgi:hypothetical protein
MKLKLLDIQVIDGVYVDRTKNLSAEHYLYEKKSKQK